MYFRTFIFYLIIYLLIYLIIHIYIYEKKEKIKVLKYKRTKV